MYKKFYRYILSFALLGALFSTQIASAEISTTDTLSASVAPVTLTGWEYASAGAGRVIRNDGLVLLWRFDDTNVTREYALVNVKTGVVTITKDSKPVLPELSVAAGEQPEYKFLYEIVCDRFVDSNGRTVFRLYPWVQELKDHAPPEDHLSVSGVSAEVKALAAQLTQGITDPSEKARTIRGWIIENIAYDDGWMTGGSIPAQSAKSTLQRKSGVCDGIANLTQELMRSAGIPCIYVTGSPSGYAHAWNEVFLDSRWISVDSMPGSGNIPFGQHVVGRGGDKGIRTASDWAVGNIFSAMDMGIVPGSIQEKYKQSITRKEFATLVVQMYEKVMGTPITGRASFTDTDDVSVQKAGFIGVIEGTGGGKFSPNAPLTREQAAALLSRTASALGVNLAVQEPSFTDASSISGYAHSAVGQMQSSRIMDGVGNNAFDPKGSYTREQSIITVLRLYDTFPAGRVAY